MNQWPDANHNQDWFASAPPKIEVRDNQQVYRNGWHVGDLVLTDSFDQDIFEGIQDALADHFNSPDNSGNPPGATARRPSTIPDTPDDIFVNLCPSPLPNNPDLWHDDLTATEFTSNLDIPQTLNVGLNVAST